MNDALPVRRLERVGDLLRDRQRDVEGHAERSNARIGAARRTRSGRPARSRISTTGDPISARVSPSTSSMMRACPEPAEWAAASSP